VGSEFIKIEASAGTGKTHRLARRYIELLMRELPLRLGSILAITFTNKAAGEMKERILAWLKEAALQGDFKWLEGKISPEERDKLRWKAKEAVENILKNYSDFRVGTIDSFVRKIALAGAYEIGLPPRFDIAQQPDPYFERALDELLESDPEMFVNYARDYVRYRLGSSWFIKRHILDNLRKIYRHRNRYINELDLPPQNFKELEEELKGLVREFLNRADTSVMRKTDLDALNMLLRGPEKGYGDLLGRAVFRAERASDLFRKEARVSEELERLWRDIREKLPGLAVSFFNLKYKNLFEVSRPILDRLEKIKRESNLIFLEELNRRVYERLKDLEVPQIYINLSEIITHFLIDEFQDTNRMQWENLKVMIEEVFSRGKGSLFVVGDRKQSIYRFRGAYPELFSRVGEEIKGPGVKLREEMLEKNWRSREVILKFVKSAFDPDNLRNHLPKDLKPDVLDLYEAVGETHNIPPELREARRGGYVEVKRLEVDSATLYERVQGEFLRIVKDVLGRYAPGDIVVLVRKGKQAARVARWLSEENIQVISQSSLNLKDHSTVMAVVSLMKFLDTPIDDLSFANFILSRLFRRVSGEAFREIVKFVVQNPPKPLYKEFQRQFPELWERYFSELFTRSVGFLPPYDLAVRIMETFSLEADLFLNQFLELLWSREALGENSLRRFLEFWDSADDELSLDMPEGIDAVRVMTIHKAKGLEAPVIIVPFAQLKTGAGRGRGQESEPYLLEEDGKAIPLDLRSKLLNNFPWLKEVYLKKLRENYIDELNALYVAFTRAKDELYIINLKFPSSKINYVGDYDFGYGREKWDENCLRLGEKGRGTPWKEAPEAEDKFVPSFSWKNKLREREEPLEGPYSSRKRGERIHRVMEALGERPPSLDRMEELTRGLSPEEREAVFWAVKENPDLFSGRVFTEFEVVDGEGNSRRLDRVVLGDEIKVFEFKTGLEYPEKHLKQLSTYLSMVSEVFPKRPLRGIILYLDSRTRREIRWENS